MNKLLAATVLACATMGFMMNSAHADIGTPIWACSMKAKLQNNSAAFILGVVDKNGPAVIKCYSLENVLSGKKIKQDAYIEIRGASVGIDIPFTDQQTVYMGTGRIGLRSPDAFYGKHSLVLSANVTLLVISAGMSTGVEWGNNVAAINRSAEISVTQGIGATLSLQNINVYHNKQEYLQAKAQRAARMQQLNDRQREHGNH